MGDDNTPSHYPLWIVSETGEHIARLKGDLTWCVRWNLVIDQAYAPPREDTATLRAVCQLLLAAKDNFWVSPWEDKIDYFSPTHIISSWFNVSDAGVVFAICGPNDVIAVVNREGVWSVDWKQISEFLAETRSTDGELETLAMLGLCNLLLKAKDNFITKPFGGGTNVNR